MLGNKFPSPYDYIRQAFSPPSQSTKSDRNLVTPPSTSGSRPFTPPDSGIEDRDTASLSLSDSDVNPDTGSDKVDGHCEGVENGNQGETVSRKEPYFLVQSSQRPQLCYGVLPPPVYDTVNKAEIRTSQMRMESIRNNRQQLKRDYSLPVSRHAKQCGHDLWKNYNAMAYGSNTIFIYGADRKMVAVPKPIICHYSKFISEMFRDRDDPCDAVIVPNYSTNVILALVNLMCTGEILFSDQLVPSLVWDLMMDLGIPCDPESFWHMGNVNLNPKIKEEDAEETSNDTVQAVSPVDFVNETSRVWDTKEIDSEVDRKEFKELSHFFEKSVYTFTQTGDDNDHNQPWWGLGIFRNARKVRMKQSTMSFAHEEGIEKAEHDRIIEEMKKLKPGEDEILINSDDEREEPEITAIGNNAPTGDLQLKAFLVPNNNESSEPVILAMKNDVPTEVKAPATKRNAPNGPEFTSLQSNASRELEAHDVQNFKNTKSEDNVIRDEEFIKLCNRNPQLKELVREAIRSGNIHFPLLQLDFDMKKSYAYNSTSKSLRILAAVPNDNPAKMKKDAETQCETPQERYYIPPNSKRRIGITIVQPPSPSAAQKKSENTLMTSQSKMPWLEPPYPKQKVSSQEVSKENPSKEPPQLDMFGTTNEAVINQKPEFQDNNAKSAPLDPAIVIPRDKWNVSEGLSSSKVGKLQNSSKIKFYDDGQQPCSSGTLKLMDEISKRKHTGFHFTPPPVKKMKFNENVTVKAIPEQFKLNEKQRQQQNQQKPFQVGTRKVPSLQKRRCSSDGEGNPQSTSVSLPETLTSGRENKNKGGAGAGNTVENTVKRGRGRPMGSLGETKRQVRGLGLSRSNSTSGTEAGGRVGTVGLGSRSRARDRSLAIVRGERGARNLDNNNLS